jgi:hypothetical protein
VGQILDYAKEACRWDCEQLASAVRDARRGLRHQRDICSGEKPLDPPPAQAYPPAHESWSSQREVCTMPVALDHGSELHGTGRRLAADIYIADVPPVAGLVRRTGTHPKGIEP